MAAVSEPADGSRPLDWGGAKHRDQFPGRFPLGGRSGDIAHLRHHAFRHVVKIVAVKDPATRIIGLESDRRHAFGWNQERITEGAVQMHGVRHSLPQTRRSNQCAKDRPPPHGVSRPAQTQGRAMGRGGPPRHQYPRADSFHQRRGAGQPPDAPAIRPGKGISVPRPWAGGCGCRSTTARRRHA